MDVPDGYSRATILQLLRDRCSYLLSRGATLNNPHINGAYFSGKKGPGTDRGPGSWLTLDLSPPNDQKRPNQHLVEEVGKALASISTWEQAGSSEINQIVLELEEEQNGV